MFDLDQEVAKAHQNVTETETQARAIEARIRKIDGAGPLLPARGYGRPVDTAAIAKGLTLRSLIAKKDPELASYLGVQTGQYAREAEARAARAMQSEAMAMRTARLREQNQQRQLQRERFANAGINQITGRRIGT